MPTKAKKSEVKIASSTVKADKKSVKKVSKKTAKSTSKADAKVVKEIKLKMPASTVKVKAEDKKSLPKETKPASTADVKAVEKKALPKFVGKPTTMEELLSATGYTLSVPKPGSVITGMVTEVTKKMILVDIGAKTEGMVVEREFDAAREYITDLKQGDEVSVYVVSPENDRGQILLSLKRALVDRKW